MKKGALIVYLLLQGVLSISCKKQVVVVPQAGMYADKTVIHKNDTITFTNTSHSDHSFVFFTRKGEELQGAHQTYFFDTQNTLKWAFNDTGDFSAVLQASNNQSGSPIRTFVIPITVNP
jgi:hypothetical protein